MLRVYTYTYRNMLQQHRNNEYVHPAVKPTPQAWIRQSMPYDPVGNTVAILSNLTGTYGCLVFFLVRDIAKIGLDLNHLLSKILFSVFVTTPVALIGFTVSVLFIASTILIDSAFAAASKIGTTLFAFLTLPFRKPLSTLLIRTSFRIQKVHANRFSNLAEGDVYTALLNDHIPAPSQSWVLRCVENAIYYGLFPIHYLVDICYQIYKQVVGSKNVTSLWNWAFIEPNSADDIKSVLLLPAVQACMGFGITLAAVLAVPVGLVGGIFGVLSAPFKQCNNTTTAAIPADDPLWEHFDGAAMNGEDNVPLVLNMNLREFKRADGKTVKVPQASLASSSSNASEANTSSRSYRL